MFCYVYYLELDTNALFGVVGDCSSDTSRKEKKKEEKSYIGKQRLSCRDMGI